MSEEIWLERTEITGHVTLIPQKRVMYTLKEYEALEANRDCWRTLSKFWRGMCELFENHYVCDECDASGATRLQKCANPLHAIQDALWEAEGKDDEA